MNILFYSSIKTGVGKNVQKTIEAKVSPDQIERCVSVEEISSRLRQPLGDLRIAILHVKSKEELFEIDSIKFLLSGIRIILILPDRDKDTIASGHKLFPRFVSYADSDFKDVGDVLKNMLAIHCST